MSSRIPDDELEFSITGQPLVLIHVDRGMGGITLRCQRIDTRKRSGRSDCSRRSRSARRIHARTRATRITRVGEAEDLQVLFGVAWLGAIPGRPHASPPARRIRTSLSLFVDAAGDSFGSAGARALVATFVDRVWCDEVETHPSDGATRRVGESCEAPSATWPTISRADGLAWFARNVGQNTAEEPRRHGSSWVRWR